jgi:hypothetical protein
MKGLKYIVTGTGRCGTVYAARLLTSVGIPCGHESAFDWSGSVSAGLRMLRRSPLNLSYASTHKRLPSGLWVEEPKWLADPQLILADSSYMAAPFVANYRDIKVIHLTRHPVRVVNSFCNYLDYFQKEEPQNNYETFIHEHVSGLRSQDCPYDRAALYYVEWNKLIEKREDAIRIRIEDCPNALLDAVGASGDCFHNPKINTFQQPKQRFCLDDLTNDAIKSDFIEMGECYGYTMSSEYLMV